MKRLIAVVLVVVMTCSLCLFTGCGKKDEPTNGGKEIVLNEDVSSNTNNNVNSVEPDTTPVVEEVEEVGYTKLEQYAVDFVTALQKDEYETALSMLKLEDATFVSLEDFKWFFPRGDFADVVGSVAEITEVTSNKDKVSDIVSMKSGINPVSVYVELNDNNEMQVVLNDVLYKDVKIAVPKNDKLSINGIEVAEKYLTELDGNNHIYTIPCMVKKTANVIVHSSVGDIPCEFMPSNDVNTITVNLTTEMVEPILEEMKNLFNEMNKTYQNGGKATDFVHFISENASPDVATRLYNQVKEEHTWNNVLNPRDILFSVVKQYADKPSYELQNNVIVLRVSIEKSWAENYSSGNSTHLNGTVTVSKNTDGTWKIYDISEQTKILSGRNSMTHDW